MVNGWMNDKPSPHMASNTRTWIWALPCSRKIPSFLMHSHWHLHRKISLQQWHTCGLLLSPIRKVWCTWRYTWNPDVYANAPVMDKLCIAIDFTTIDIEGVNVYSFVFLLNSNVAQKWKCIKYGLKFVSGRHYIACSHTLLFSFTYIL